VTLTFVNASSKGHDFTAPAFFRSARILTGNAAKGEVELGGGESRSVTLVPAAGTYEAHCGHPFHSMMGMHTQIVVR
jgi:plastocyanin